MTTIKELRTNKGDTQQHLATILGITRGAYANIEDGRREPDISTLIRLSDYFNVSVDYLINHEKGDFAMDTLGKRIAAKREELGLSQEDLAKCLSIEPAKLNYWEADESEPDFEMIEKIAKALKVMPEFLRGIWTEDMYEDFKGASEKEKLGLFEKWGVPSDLRWTYRKLCRDKADKSQKPTEDELYMIKLFQRAGDEVKTAIWSMLKNYEETEKKSSNAG